MYSFTPSLPVVAPLGAVVGNEGATGSLEATGPVLGAGAGARFGVAGASGLLRDIIRTSATPAATIKAPTATISFMP